MALAFPNNPVPGQLYTDVSNNYTYQWRVDPQSLTSQGKWIVRVSGVNNNPYGPQGHQGFQGHPGTVSTVPGPQGNQGNVGLLKARGSATWVVIEDILTAEYGDAYVLTDITAGDNPPPTRPGGGAAQVGDVIILSIDVNDDLNWINLGDVSGPQGNQGFQGNQGNQGDQGNQGNQGNQGFQGVASTVAGPQGDQGAQGHQGVESTVPGPQGPPFTELVTEIVPGLHPATGFSTITYAASIELDVTALNSQYRTISLTGNVAFTTTNRANGRAVSLRLICDGSARTLTFPGGWKFLGVMPSSIAANKVAVLLLTFFGSADSDCIVAYGVEP